MKPGISRSFREPNETIVLDDSIKIEQEDEGSSSTASEFTEVLLINNSHPSKTDKKEETVASLTPNKEQSEEPSIDLTQKIGIEDKIDLYKAVFLSSSESEDETEDQNNKKDAEQNKIEEFKAAILSEPLLPQIKPIKEGILSGINFRHFNMNRNKIQIEDNEDKREKSTDVPVPKNPFLYGPQAPLPRSENQCVPDIKQSVVISSDSEEEWIEKDATKTKKKSKHKKKDKKHKKYKKKNRKQEKR